MSKISKMEDFCRKFDIDKLRITLIKISNQLDELNHLQLTFLCHDEASEHFHSSLDLLNELLRKRLIHPHNVIYLVELLWRIWRKDLIKKYLVIDMQICDDYFKNPQHSQISYYRCEHIFYRMIYERTMFIM